MNSHERRAVSVEVRLLCSLSCWFYYSNNICRLWNTFPKWAVFYLILGDRCPSCHVQAATFRGRAFFLVQKYPPPVCRRMYVCAHAQPYSLTYKTQAALEVAGQTSKGFADEDQRFAKDRGTQLHPLHCPPPLFLLGEKKKRGKKIQAFKICFV